MTTREIIRNAHRAQWGWIRRLGMLRYIILYGLVWWALPMFLLFVMVGSRPSFEWPPSASSVVITAAICLVGGILYGLFTWRDSEKKFRESSDRDSTQKA